MRLFSPGVKANISGGQIQKAFQKLAITISGPKSAGVNTNVQFAADLANIYFSLRRVGGKLGEKIVWPRINGQELLSVGLANYGYAKTTGTLAATSYSGYFTIDINRHAAHSLADSAYLELNLENSVDNLAVVVDGVGCHEANFNLNRIEREVFKNGESKQRAINGTDMIGAYKLLLPATISSVRFNSSDPFTADQYDIAGQLTDETALILNVGDCGMAQPSHAPFNIDDNCRSADVDNGGADSTVLILREMFY